MATIIIERLVNEVLSGNFQVLKKLTKRKCSMQITDEGWTLLHVASRHGKLKCLSILIERGGDPEQTDRLGNTCLHAAVAAGQLNTVSFLLNYGVNMMPLNHDRLTPLEIALTHGYMDIVKLIDKTLSSKHSSKSAPHVNSEIITSFAANQSRLLTGYLGGSKALLFQSAESTEVIFSHSDKHCLSNKLTDFRLKRTVPQQNSLAASSHSQSIANYSTLDREDNSHTSSCPIMGTENFPCPMESAVYEDIRIIRIDSAEGKNSPTVDKDVEAFLVGNSLTELRWFFAEECLVFDDLPYIESEDLSCRGVSRETAERLIIAISKLIIHHNTETGNEIADRKLHKEKPNPETCTTRM